MFPYSANLLNSFSFTIPKEFSCYESISIIGDGTFSYVVLCRNHKDKQLYAAKFCSRKMYSELKNMQRLEREVRLLQQLDHPNIVKIIDIIYLEETVAIITPYYKNKDLLEKNSFLQGLTF